MIKLIKYIIYKKKTRKTTSVYLDYENGIIL
jgi:hypothetical protein